MYKVLLVDDINKEKTKKTWAWIYTLYTDFYTNVKNSVDILRPL